MRKLIVYLRPTNLMNFEPADKPMFRVTGVYPEVVVEVPSWEEAQHQARLMSKRGLSTKIETVYDLIDKPVGGAQGSSEPGGTAAETLLLSPPGGGTTVHESEQ